MHATGSYPSKYHATTSSAAATITSRDVVTSEPDQLAMSEEMQFAAASNRDKDLHTSQEIKALAKELDEQDRQAKLQHRQKMDAPGVTIVHHERQPFPHEKFGKNRNGKASLAATSSLAAPVGGCDPPDDEDGDPSHGDEETGNRTNLVEAVLVDRDSQNNRNEGSSGNILVDTSTIPKAEIVRADDASLWAKCIPPTTGSKVFCFGILFLLAAVTAVGLVCGSGVCSTAEEPVSQTMSPTTMPPGMDSVNAFGRTWGVAATTSIKIWNRQLTGTIPTELKFLTALTGVSLYENQLTGTLPSELGMLTALTSLRLYSNQLGGSLPSELGMLTALKTLHLGNNQLTGTVPSTLGVLTQLSHLLLYNNTLTGTIPSEIGMLTELVALGLSENKLTGKIPSDTGMLTALTFLSLYGNEFTGKVPSQLLVLSNGLSIGLHDSFQQDDP